LLAIAATSRSLAQAICGWTRPPGPRCRRWRVLGRRCRRRGECAPPL